ncbi:hypothetical protein GCM10009679_14610 [Saccharothrix algeriensis]|uniref:Uncharacterized protein n=1 Tax=Catellatospora bangladeshensis TaxID=310355 RepID=A0A8J3JDY7_9ACTN|nr:hypothetical protein Cba03nite_01510 [Catellatospora bangladeshensis]
MRSPARPATLRRARNPEVAVLGRVTASGRLIDPFGQRAPLGEVPVAAAHNFGVVATTQKL